MKFRKLRIAWSLFWVPLVLPFIVASACYGVEKVSVETWIKELQRPEPERRGLAAQMLGDLRAAAEPAIPALIDALADTERAIEFNPSFPGPYPLVATYASDALVKIGKPTVPTLVNALDKESKAATSRIMIETLGRIGKPAAAAIPTLEQIVSKSTSAELRGAALAAWGEIHGPGPEYVKFVAAALKDKSPDVRGLAASLLGGSGKQAAPVTNELTCLLADKESRWIAEAADAARTRPVRFDAAEALGLIGPAAMSANVALKNVMNCDRDDEVRVAAALALFRIDEKNSVALNFLIAALRRDNVGTAGPIEAAHALEELGPKAKVALAPLAMCLRHEDSFVRLAAIDAIAAVGGKAVIPKLETALTDNDEFVRDAAADAIKKLRGKQ